MPACPSLLLHMGKLKQRVWQKRHVGLSPREAVGTEPSALPNPTHCKSILRGELECAARVLW